MKRLLAWWRAFWTPIPLEQRTDQEIWDMWADYSATKDWDVVNTLVWELKRRGLA